MSSVALIAVPCDVQTVGDQKRYTVDTIPVDDPGYEERFLAAMMTANERRALFEAEEP